MPCERDGRSGPRRTSRAAGPRPSRGCRGHRRRRRQHAWASGDPFTFLTSDGVDASRLEGCTGSLVGWPAHATLGCGQSSCGRRWASSASVPAPLRNPIRHRRRERRESPSPPCSPAQIQQSCPSGVSTRCGPPPNRCRSVPCSSSRSCPACFAAWEAVGAGASAPIAATDRCAPVATPFFCGHHPSSSSPEVSRLSAASSEPVVAVPLQPGPAE